VLLPLVPKNARCGADVAPPAMPYNSHIAAHTAAQSDHGKREGQAVQVGLILGQTVSTRCCPASVKAGAAAL